MIEDVLQTLQILVAKRFWEQRYLSKSSEATMDRGVPRFVHQAWVRPAKNIFKLSLSSPTFWVKDNQYIQNEFRLPKSHLAQPVPSIPSSLWCYHCFFRYSLQSKNSIKTIPVKLRLVVLLGNPWQMIVSFWSYPLLLTQGKRDHNQLISNLSSNDVKLSEYVEKGKN